MFSAEQRNRFVSGLIGFPFAPVLSFLCFIASLAYEISSLIIISLFLVFLFSLSLTERQSRQFSTFVVVCVIFFTVCTLGISLPSLFCWSVWNFVLVAPISLFFPSFVDLYLTVWGSIILGSIIFFYFFARKFPR